MADDIIYSDILNLEKDIFKEQRQHIVSEYHPYNDGNSALRMVEAVENYINKNHICTFGQLYISDLLLNYYP